MADDIRNIRYRIYADADQFHQEIEKTSRDLTEFDRKMQQLGRSSRADVALMRDSIAQNRLATADAIDLLERQRRRVQIVYGDIKRERIQAAKAALEAEANMEQKAFADRIANARKTAEAKSRIYTEEKQELKEVSALSRRLDKEKLESARALELANKRAAAAQAGFTGGALSRAVRDDAYKVQALARLDFERRTNAAAEAHKRREALETSTIQKAAALDTFHEKVKLIEKEAARRAQISGKSMRDHLEQVAYEVEIEKRLRTELLDRQIGGLQRHQREQAALKGQIIQHSNDIERAYNRQANALRTIGQAATNLGQTMTRVGVMSSIAITAPTALIARMGFRFNAMRENATNAFAEIMDSAEAANAMMQKLYEFAKPTAFEFQNIVASAARLKNVGFKDEQLLPVLTRVAKITALSQVSGRDPGAEIKQVVDLIAKIQGRGNLTLMNLRSLDRVYNFSQYYLRALGIENSTLQQREAFYKAITKRQIDSASVLKVLFESIDDKAKDILTRQQQSFDGLMNNLRESLNLALGDALLPFFEETKKFITWLIPRVEYLGKWFQSLDPLMKKAILGTIALAAAFGPILIIVGQITSVFGGLISGIALLKIAAFSLSTTVGEGMLGAGLAASVGSIVGTMKAAFLGFIAWFWSVFPAIGTFFSTVLAGAIGLVTNAVTSLFYVFSSGPVIGFLSLATSGVFGLITAFETLGGIASTVFSAIYAGVATASIAFLKVAIPILAVAAIVGSVIRVIMTYWDQIAAGFRKAWEFVTRYFETNVAGPLSKIGTQIWIDAREAYLEFSDLFVDVFGEIIAWFQTNWSTIKDAATTVLNGLFGIVKAVGALILAYWYAWGPLIVETIKGVWGTVKAIVLGTLDIILDVVLLFTSALAGDWDKFWHTMGKLVYDGGKLIVTVAQAFLTGLWNAFKAAVWGILSTFLQLPIKMQEALTNGLKSMIESVFSAGPGMFAAFANLANKAWEGFVSGVTGRSMPGEAAAGLPQAPNLTVQPNQQQADERAAALARIEREKRDNVIGRGLAAFTDWANKALVRSGGKTGFEGVEHPELDFDAAGGAGSKSARQEYDKAAGAIRNLEKEVAKLNNTLGLTSVTISKDFRTAFENYYKMQEDAEKAMKAAKDAASRQLGEGKTRDFVAKQVELGQKAYNQLLSSGLGEFESEILAAHTEMNDKVEDYKNKYIDAFKVGTRQRMEGEQHLADFQALAQQQYLQREIQAYAKLFQYRRDTVYKIQDISYEGAFREADQRIEQDRRALEAFEEDQKRHNGNSFVGQLATIVSVYDFRRAKEASFNRWRMEQEREFSRAVQDARFAGSGDTYSQERAQIERGIEDFNRASRSKLITEKTTADERARIEAGLAQFADAQWAAFHRKEEERQKAAIKERRDAQIALIYDEVARRKAEFAAVGQDAFEARWKEVAHDVWGLAQALKAAAEAQAMYNMKLAEGLRNQLRSELEGADPLMKFDAAKQRAMTAAIDAAVPIMIKYGLTLEFIKSTMGDVALTAESLTKRLAELTAALEKGSGVKKARKGIEDLRKEFKDQIKEIFDWREAVDTVGVAIGNAFALWASGAASLGEALKSAILGALGDIASAAGDVFIKWGIAEIAAWNFAKGAALIAAGLGLKILGGFLSGKAQSSAATASGATASSAAAGANDQANGGRRDVRGTEFNTSGPQVVIVKFDTKNMNKGMKKMFEGARAYTAKGSARQIRKQLQDALG